MSYDWEPKFIQSESSVEFFQPTITYFASQYVFYINEQHLIINFITIIRYYMYIYIWNTSIKLCLFVPSLFFCLFISSLFFFSYILLLITNWKTFFGFYFEFLSIPAKTYFLLPFCLSPLKSYSLPALLSLLGLPFPPPATPRCPGELQKCPK